jgi:hypothetical protein
MNFLDLLTRLQIPAWLVIVLGAMGVLAMTRYKYLLDKRIKQLEHDLHVEATRFEKSLDLLQEQHRQRFAALGQVSAAIREFQHGVGHLIRGDTEYLEEVKVHSARARKLSRENGTLLGEEFIAAVTDFTDKGRAILSASFVISPRALTLLKWSEELGTELTLVEAHVGERVKVADSYAWFAANDEGALLPFRGHILAKCDIDGFEKDDYQESSLRLRHLSEQVLQSLLTLPASAGGVDDEATARPSASRGVIPR